MDEKTFHYKLKKIHFLDFLGLNYIKNCGCFFRKYLDFLIRKKRIDIQFDQIIDLLTT